MDLSIVRAGCICGLLFWSQIGLGAETTPSDTITADSFDYRAVVSLVQVTPQGMYIYGPVNTGTDISPSNGFIQSYTIIYKYIARLHTQNPDLIALDRSSLPTEATIILINNNASKKLFLGDHWLGNATNFVLMDDMDYRRLSAIFASRKNHAEAEPLKYLHSWVKHIHQYWITDPDYYASALYAPAQHLGPPTAEAVTADQPLSHNQEVTTATDQHHSLGPWNSTTPSSVSGANTPGAVSSPIPAKIQTLPQATNNPDQAPSESSRNTSSRLPPSPQRAESPHPWLNYLTGLCLLAFAIMVLLKRSRH